MREITVELIGEYQLHRLQRNQSSCTPEASLPSGFSLKKKAP
jgi:hypothetical protein